MDYLQKWWEEKYPKAGVRNIVNVSEGVITLEDLQDFEKWLVKRLTKKDNDVMLMQENVNSKAINELNKRFNSCVQEWRIVKEDLLSEINILKEKVFDLKHKT